MINSKEYEIYLDNLLNAPFYKDKDISSNSLVVGRSDKIIKKVMSAVDISMQSIEITIENKVDAIITHHGFFWGKPLKIIDSHYNRIKALIENDICLYTYHLPLDANNEVGNNIVMAKALNLLDIKPFGYYAGLPIGYKGRLKESIKVEEILKKLNIDKDYTAVIFKDKIKEIGIVSGGAAKCIDEAINDKLDLFISGENSHEQYHNCKENNLNLLFLGHYQSETFGVRALVERSAKKFNLEYYHSDIPTRM